MLLQRARELIDDPAQGVLDLGVESTPRVLPLAGAPAGQDVLPAMPASPAGGSAAARDSGGRVLATGSRLLHDALRGVVTSLGFASATDEVFCDLVIARIVEPTSLMDAGRVLTDGASADQLRHDEAGPQARLGPEVPRQDRQGVLRARQQRRGSDVVPL